MFLDYSHNYLFVFAAVAVSLMASFTGLALTRGVSLLPENQRKQRIAMASVALGGGIWAMHFVAMLGLQLPILFYYDALTTLISALTAILVVGIALLVMHFRKRTRLSIILAGTIAGLGISAMHYIGMSGMQLCTAVYTPFGVLLAVASSVVLGIGTFAIAYGERTHRSIILGTLTFGTAVCAVHFLAMAGTNYLEVDNVGSLAALIDNETLALIVTLIAFFICGGFLLLGVTFIPAPTATVPLVEQGKPASPTTSVPYQKDGHVQFIRPAEIAALRAEGHYSIIYTGSDKLFCPWSITEAESRLLEGSFIRCHRSYLINPEHVTSFERKKDSGVCLFAGSPALGAVPVSRSRMAEVRTAFGLI
ncbi:MHYT domain-containing protein [Falsihalocynthiibacter arcticus]|uniref:MHYT domain-containing protein n=1 Tax=Falsihalocynthiibacter arcticus TaxID=1579316 RepID=UPI000579179A|nr:MHYT domain-containing protein [Falsihalocynthiibacter arcticus]